MNSFLVYTQTTKGSASLELRVQTSWPFLFVTFCFGHNVILFLLTQVTAISTVKWMMYHMADYYHVVLVSCSLEEGSPIDSFLQRSTQCLKVFECSSSERSSSAEIGAQTNSHYLPLVQAQVQHYSTGKGSSSDLFFWKRVYFQSLFLHLLINTYVSAKIGSIAYIYFPPLVSHFCNEY